MDRILGDVISQVERSLRFRTAREAVLAANVANVDTPGYRPNDLRFDELLGEANARLARTDARHLDAGAGAGRAAGPYSVTEGDGGTRPDGNGVDLEQQLIALSRNASAFNHQANALSRLVALTRDAISGGR